ncbi:trypco2 family protein [Streptomyces sp. NPDC056161]|uniref:trypco2 family protein n=1 Tax=Streptomyces sp. NPDC056161 TaxID=3345732 RepID=UPI0035DBCD70
MKFLGEPEVAATVPNRSVQAMDRARVVGDRQLVSVQGARVIELASVIRDLREELQQAVVAAQGETLRFELGTIELELSVALERTGHAEARVRFWVVESGADATVNSTSTQLVKLTLQPTLQGSPDRPFVVGRADPDEQ